MKKSLIIAAFALFASTAAFAQTTSTFDPATGTGFAAKGDVQLVLGLNNAGLQNTPISFTYEAVVVSEVTWECTNDRNENVQQRERKTTSTVSGVVSSTARVRNQITGFNLTGFGASTTSSSTTDGPPLNSCPTSNTLTSPAGDPVVISSTGGLFVNGVSLPTL